MRNYLAAVLGAVMLCVSFACATRSNPAAEKAALESAGQWINLVDNRQYAESWDAAAGYFQAAVGREKWLESLQAVRSPLGKVVSREVKSKRYVTALPGAPDGEYVVIRYQTSFENKKTGIETVTPMLDKDGKWRVSGYFIN